MVLGSIYMYAGYTPPPNFLLCDGSAVSRTTYSDLYEAIGTTFGDGDGNFTFNLPNLCGRVVVGVSQNETLGHSAGEETHTLLVSEIPQHYHTVPQHGHANTITATTPAFSHSITQPTFNYAGSNGTGKGSNATNGGVSYNGNTSATASRTRNVSVAAHDAASCTMSGGVTDCNAFDTDSSGSNVSHNNMQPYTALNFIIYSGV